MEGKYWDVLGKIGLTVGLALLAAWLVLALFCSYPNGYYVAAKATGVCHVMQDIRFGEDRCLYRGDAGRAYTLLYNLRHDTAQMDAPGGKTALLGRTTQL